MYDEASWDIWLTMRAFDYKFLPLAGGLLDQPDSMMHDIITIESEYNRLQNEMRKNG